MHIGRSFATLGLAGALVLGAGGFAAAQSADTGDDLLAALGLDDDQIEATGDEVEDAIETLIEAGLIDEERLAEIRRAAADGTLGDDVRERVERARQRWTEVREERLAAWQIVRDDFLDCVEGGDDRFECRGDARDAMDALRDEWRDELEERREEREDEREERQDEREERREDREERREEIEDRLDDLDDDADDLGDDVDDADDLGDDLDDGDDVGEDVDDGDDVGDDLDDGDDVGEDVDDSDDLDDAEDVEVDDSEDLDDGDGAGDDAGDDDADRDDE
jgi:hypothetical protein